MTTHCLDQSQKGDFISTFHVLLLYKYLVVRKGQLFRRQAEPQMLALGSGKFWNQSSVKRLIACFVKTFTKSLNLLSCVDIQFSSGLVFKNSEPRTHSWSVRFLCFSNINNKNTISSFIWRHPTWFLTDQQRLENRPRRQVDVKVEQGRPHTKVGTTVLIEQCTIGQNPNLFSQVTYVLPLVFIISLNCKQSVHWYLL